VSAESRDRFVAGLRAAADLYEQHEDMVVPSTPVRIYAAPFTAGREGGLLALHTAVRVTGHHPTAATDAIYAEVKITEQIILCFDLTLVADKQTVTREVVAYVLPTAVAS
jgi:hypothetical protein